ncbi:glycoside hydrolase family 2 TIM barrel-domain containing protein [Nannocystis sp. SCPEA4]|uniref:glycoside hydrolase family 2 TIM barrel-domain containing protein n=1 Tax=Nannocystis sp. SCPEA4 TaxID=2996787 RepID=UPI00226E8852|nr:glycoside hydrolase family 2 TIM barrel-domain containing protein [Nannocystis sp. SCPEA4]MCY1059207.1 hypothetical protein [Nannocystis sp. SCPEA4]
MRSHALFYLEHRLLFAAVAMRDNPAMSLDRRRSRGCTVALASLLACGDAGGGVTEAATTSGPGTGDPLPTGTSTDPGATATTTTADPPPTTGTITTADPPPGTTTKPDPTGDPSGCVPVSPTASAVCVENRQLLVGRREDGTLMPATPCRIKGVGWSPTGIGETNTQGYANYYTQYGSDALHIEALNANTVKTYDPFAQTAEGLALLDDLHSRGIMVAMTVIAWHGDAGPKNYLAAVNHFKDHPAILMWLVGNEFNYNNLYGAADLDAATAIVNQAIADIHAADPDHPVAVGHGEVPSPERYAAIPDADIWALNLYPALDLDSRFEAWPALSDKPMFVSEYGADAFDNNDGEEDQAAQAEATEILTLQIADHYSADDPAESGLGGTIFVLTDEWWKADGSADAQDNGGFPGAIHDDGFANEEWWGLLDIERNPRAAFTALQTIYAP